MHRVVTIRVDDHTRKMFTVWTSHSARCSPSVRFWTFWTSHGTHIETDEKGEKNETHVYGLQSRSKLSGRQPFERECSESGQARREWALLTSEWRCACVCGKDSRMVSSGSLGRKFPRLPFGFPQLRVPWSSSGISRKAAKEGTCLLFSPSNLILKRSQRIFVLFHLFLKSRLPFQCSRSSQWL